MPLYTGLEFTKIFAFDGTTYNDVTLEAQSPGGTSFTIFHNATSYLYLGHDEKFDMAVFDVDLAASIGALPWEFFNGSAWIEFVPASGRLVHDPDVQTEYGLAYSFNKDGDASWEGKVFVVEKLGSGTFLYIEKDGDPLVVEAEGDSNIKVGDTIKVSFVGSRCHLFDSSNNAFN